jgi:hypothetical protein
MLYLNPPYHIIDGVSLLPDHEDPLQYYFMPLSPHLTMLTDSATGQKVPQLQVIMYTGSTASGGFLNFDCNLGATEEHLAEIGEQLRDRERLPGLPKLAPVPLVDGSVRMMLLGKESPPPPDAEKPKPPAGAPPPPPTGPQFVTKISHYTKPSLYGDNQAAFSVALDPEGVTILEQAIKGELSPIGVVYGLTYVGLRPAYNVRLTVDWNRVQTHLAESFGVNTLIFSAEIDKVVDKLVDDRVIVLEADTFVAEGDGSDDVFARRDQALDEVREMITETFFEPSVDPVEDAGKGGFLDTMKRTSQFAATGGHGSLFTQRSVDLTRIDQKSLNVSFSERTAVRRSIYPQGHLSGLLRVLEQQHLDATRFILRVGLDDDFFKRRKVRVVPYVNFEPTGGDPDQVQSVNVSVKYAGETKNVIFDRSHPGEQAVEWTSVLDGDVMRKDAEVGYTVNFTGTPSFGRPASLTKAPQVTQGDAVTISPRGDLYEVRPIVVNCIDFPWATYRTVELECAYEDEANDIHLSGQFVLTSETVQQFTWPVFSLDPAKRSVRYRLVYHGVDGRDVEPGWQETAEDTIRVVDPFPRKRRVAVVVPQAIFQTVERAFVDLSYEDAANDVLKEETFEFNANDVVTKTFVVELVDPAQRQVRFTTTFLMLNGSTIEVPTSDTLEERIRLRPDMRGHRTVALRCEPREFARKGLREIVVDAEYKDDAAKLSFADKARFTKSTDVGSFEFEYVDVTKDTYRYRITRQYTNGLSRESNWQESDAPQLVVSVE